MNACRLVLLVATPLALLSCADGVPEEEVPRAGEVAEAQTERPGEQPRDSAPVPPDLRLDTVTPHPDFVGPRPPMLTTVLIRPDTVWFLGGTPRDGLVEVSYAYVRSTGEWLRRGGRPDLERRAPVTDRWRQHGPIAVAPGVRLVVQPDSDHFHVLETDDGARRGIPKEIDPAMKRRLVDAVVTTFRPTDLEFDRIRPEPTVSAWVVQDSTLWLGRAGSWVQGQRVRLGGLVRYDLRSHELDAVWSESLADATVSGLAHAGGRLWVGTLVLGSDAAHGGPGVLRYVPERDEWDGLTPESAPLPSALVWSLVGAGDSVWISTDGGLAAVDARTGDWDVRYFPHTMAGDPTLHRVPVDPVGEVSERLIALLQVPSPDAFMRVAREAPVEPFVEVYRSNDGWARPLAHPSFFNHLWAATRLDGVPSATAMSALRLLREASWDPTPVMESWGAEDLHNSVETASLLARAGYPEGLAWLRQTLADPAITGDKTRIMTVLGELRDTASITQLARHMTGTFEGSFAYSALKMMRSDAAWIAIVEAARDVGGDPSGTILVDALAEGSGAPLGNRRFTNLLSWLARLALAGHWSSRLDAAEFLMRYGDSSDVGLGARVLLDLLRDGELYSSPATALVRLTGVDTAPPLGDPAGAAAARARLVDFWETWWLENAHGFQAVSVEEGQEAERRWRARAGG